MTTMQLLIVCATVLILGRSALGAWSSIAAGRARVPTPDVPPARVGHRVTVHTKQPDDQTLYGVLAADYADRIVLEHAEYVTPDGPRPLPGAQHVAVSDIAWLDVHALVTIPNVPASVQIEAT